MEEVVVTSVILFPFLLFCLSAIQEAVLTPPEQIGWFHRSEFSVKDIFTDNHNWDRYYYHHRREIRPIEREEVEKMMSCKGTDRGCYVYQCPKCGEYRDISLGCNSRLCSDCGKRYTDQWAKRLSSRMFDVPHRHAVMTLPDKLRGVLKEDRGLWKVVMDSAIRALNDTLSHALRKDVLAGAIVVLHPFGRNLGFNLHIHLLLTEGGFDRSKKFIHKKYIPFRALRRTWQYQVLTNLKKALPGTKENAMLIDRMFKDYPEGFYVHAPEESRIMSLHKISRYVARYVRHPAIANSRICGYNGREVTFWYVDQEDVKHYETMSVEEFISAIIQHVPERQFKMIRYYGSYCRKWKSRYKRYLSHSSIRQYELADFGNNKWPRCPKCGTQMEFVMFFKKDPPLLSEKWGFGTKLDDWNYLCAS
jgi:Putative transposase/Transposase zinc-binding domain